MAIVAKFFRDLMVIDTPPANSTGVALPASVSWMPKGNYRFGENDYDCTQAGLYRFWDQGTMVIHNRLVHAFPNSVESDLYGLMSGISWLHSHDIGDEQIAGDALARAGQNHVWHLKCGQITNLVRWFMDKFGYQSRRVKLVAADQWAVMNGHIVVEVYHEGRWRLWDISNGVYFAQHGVHLGIEEIAGAGVLNCDRVRIDRTHKRGSSLSGTWCSRSVNDLLFVDGDDWWFERMYGGTFTISS